MILLNFNSSFILPSLKTILFLSAGSFLEVFITIVFAYLSFRYIQAFKTSITMSAKGIFALFSSWIFLNLEPGVYQITGGILSLAGVILVSGETIKKHKAVIK
jgi:drug/metabolite transporter (DMT)-like permease